MPCQRYAKCSDCFLGSVGGDLFMGIKQTIRSSPSLVIVMDRPSMQDKGNGWLLSDIVGAAMSTLCAGLKLDRKSVSVLSVVGCPSPADNPKQVASQVRRHRAARAANPSLPVKEDPDDICGLGDEAAATIAAHGAPVLLMGDAAFARFCPPEMKEHSAESGRGTVWQAGGIWYGSTYSLRKATGDGTLMPVIMSDARKLMAYHAGYRWMDCDTSDAVVFPDTARITADLSALVAWSKAEKAEGRDGAVAYDTETDSKNPMQANLRCVQFSNGALTCIVPLLKNNGVRWPDWDRRIRLLRRFFEVVPVFGHNSGTYDALVIEQSLGITPMMETDTILLDQLSDNNLPHRLGFAVSYRTMAPDAWKADHQATEAQSEKELYVYALRDAHRTWLLRGKLEPIVDSRGQRHLVEREKTLQLIGKKMQRLGLRVNLEAAKVRRDETRDRLNGLLSEFRNAMPAESKSLNPMSSKQLSALLYDKWALPVPEYSEDTGDPSVDDSAMRKMLIEWTLSQEQRDIIQLVRRAKSDFKLLGTYLLPLIPWGQTYKNASGQERPGIVGPDGRVHPTYSRRPSSGRYSSSDPNAQNIDNHTRGLYVPEDGHVFVGCDSKALELACIGEAAQAAHIINWFNSPGVCPHNETMEGVYGPGIWNMAGAPKTRGKKGDPGSVFYNTRGLIKNVRYASIYAAGAPTVWKQVTAAEDENRNLLYAAITLSQVRFIVEKLKTLDPEIPAWWQSQKEDIRRRGYVEDPLWGRRRYLPPDGNLSEVVNHPIQAMGFVIVAEAMYELMYGPQPWFTTYTAGPRPDFDPDIFRFQFSQRTGQVTNTHDSLVWEVKESDGDAALAGLTWAMTRKTRRYGYLTYDAEGKKGKTWEEV